MPSNNPEHIIRDIKRLVEAGRQSEIRLKANGGNSILLVCDPMKEKEYIAHLEEHLPAHDYFLIDLNQCLMEFVTNHKDQVFERYDLLPSATHQIFKAPAGEESNDLLKEIVALIHQALQDNKIPVLTNTGALYGTGIHNIHLMEHGIVMNAALPLIILYPATIEKDRILFLGKQPASKYRCMIIQ